MPPPRPLRVFLPYCAQRLNGDTYILVGRDYKPIGLPQDGWVKWSDHPLVYEIADLNPAAARAISWNRDANTDWIYFYNDGCAPWLGAKALAAYEERLAKFLELSIQPLVRSGAAASGIGLDAAPLPH